MKCVLFLPHTREEKKTGELTSWRGVCCALGNHQKMCRRRFIVFIGVNICAFEGLVEVTADVYFLYRPS